MSDIERVLRELADSQHELAALRAERDRLVVDLDRERAARRVVDMAFKDCMSERDRLRHHMEKAIDLLSKEEHIEINGHVFAAIVHLRAALAEGERAKP